ncbi:MAG: HDOD domain-containing protein [Thermoguttaceae bacterium]|nr:HDOD domain-containing protein [Thermoguttaceae bacterium]
MPSVADASWSAGGELQRPPSLDAVLRRIHSISTLPQVALRVMEIAQDPSSSVQDLKQVMEADPALSARVLKCVNSSAYALRSKITNLQHAIAYLGVKQIRNVAMTAAVSDLFKKGCAIGAYTRVGLWKHLVAVGICARLIGMRRRLNNFEDMFLAGLLHDIGIILEDEYLNTHFLATIAALPGAASLTGAERQQMGFDHTVLGEAVGRNWRFPDSSIAALRHHHASGNAPEEFREVVQCVEMANVICTLKGMSSVGVNLVAFSKPVIEALSLTKEDIIVLAQDLDHEIERNQNLLTM